MQALSVGGGGGGGGGTGGNAQSCTSAQCICLHTASAQRFCTALARKLSVFVPPVPSPATSTHAQNRGNVLKVDRHKYVKIGYHGFQPLTSEERKRMYNSTFQVRARGVCVTWRRAQCCLQGAQARVHLKCLSGAPAVRGKALGSVLRVGSASASVALHIPGACAVW